MGNFKLQKGERFSLSKAAPGLKQIKVGMGWDPNEQPGGPEFDLDVSAFAIGSDFRIPSDSYFIFYGQIELGNCKEDPAERGLFRPVTEDGAITGAIDDPDGRRSDGDDDEDMLIDLSKVSSQVEQIILCCTICKYPNDIKKDRRTLSLNFGQISGCYIRLVDEHTNEEIARYDLKERFTNEDALEFGRLFRADRGWEFEAMGRAHTGSLQTLVDLYT